jgi:hypothetical protein
MAAIVANCEPSVMTERQLALRAEIMRAFAETGAPPAVAPSADLDALAGHHVVALDDGAIWMAHPFAAHRGGARVESGGREWWGNCAWDALGIVAALGLRDAVVTAQDVTLPVRDGEPDGNAVFHVEVPARHWWDDIAHT